MGKFTNKVVTDLGEQLQSHVQAGAVFTPTRIVMGSGTLASGTTTKSVKALMQQVQSLTISKKKRSNDGYVTIGGVYSNEAVTTDFYFRELGLYAKAVYPDGTEIAEVLYCYGTSADPDLMPAYTSGEPVTREIDLIIYVGTDAQVNLTIENGVYAPKIHAEQHAEGGEDPLTPAMIGAVSKQYMLFGTVDLNGVLTTGFYRLQADTVTGGPPGIDVNYSQMQVVMAGGDTVAQTIYYWNDPRVFMRSGKYVNGNSATWTRWVEFSNTEGDFLPRDGSKPMLADLRFANGLGSIGGNEGLANLAHRVSTDTLDWRYISVSKQSGLAHGATLCDTVNGETFYYQLFGEHNLELMKQYFVPVAVYPASVE